MSKLLIVSDSGRFRRWARLIVEAEGFTALEARDGLAALQYAVEEKPTMILVDPDLARVPADRDTASPRSGALTCQGLSAGDVQRRLSREAQTRAIPVVLPISAFVRCAYRDEREGAFDPSVRRSTATLSLRETIETVSRFGAAGRHEYRTRDHERAAHQGERVGSIPEYE